MWAARRDRAARLLRDAPHAEEILVFYVQLTEVQEWVAESLSVDGENRAIASDEASPPVGLQRVPRDELLVLFDGFLQRIQAVGTDVIAAKSRALLESGPSDRFALLEGREGFHGRAFLEAVMTTLASTTSAGPPSGAPGRCHRCGSLPLVGVLQDAPGALGARTLLCSLCSSEWRVDRLLCAHCGETSSDGLRIHSAESVPWIRVDECRTCRRYLKSIDLRERGDAVPVVDEIATVELDVWAWERGLTKIQPNVLEL